MTVVGGPRQRFLVRNSPVVWVQMHETKPNGEAEGEIKFRLRQNREWKAPVRQSSKRSPKAEGLRVCGLRFGARNGGGMGDEGAPGAATIKVNVVWVRSVLFRTGGAEKDQSLSGEMVSLNSK